MIVVMARAYASAHVALRCCSIGDYLVNDKVAIFVWTICALCSNLLTLAGRLISCHALLSLRFSQLVLGDQTSFFHVGAFVSSPGYACAKQQGECRKKYLMFAHSYIKFTILIFIYFK